MIDAGPFGMGATHDFAGNARFELLTRLGQGGMGSVYQVIDRSRNVRVALKSVGRVYGDGLLRFKREYRALQEIRHPNLVELGELIEVDQSWFFTMELIDGVDFYSYVRTDHTTADNDNARPSSVPSLDAQLGRPVAPASAGFSEARLRRGLAGLVSGVAALHARGLMHRDLKPANVLVSDEGRVVLIDFGLVTGVERSNQSTELQVVGTVSYMSPEQAAQEVIGPASDWYSVGVILYRCLTGRVPIDDGHLRLLLRKQHEVPPSPRSLVPEVPADLDALCMALLEIDPRKRPAVQEIYRRLHVDAPIPDAAPSTSLSVAGLPEVFVGRTCELARLSQAFATACAGQQCTVNVVGPSGVGKSALLRQFEAELAAADASTLVLRGQCREHETVPYKALDGVMDALSKWLKGQPSEQVKSLLPADILLIATTFTVLERVPAVRTAQHRARIAKDPQERRLALLGAVRELLRRIAERRRTVLILEDMHWSDEDSFHLLHELTRAPDAPPLLIVYSRQPRLAEAVDDRGRLEPGAQEEIDLRPLDRADSLALARRIKRGHADAELREIVEQAEGYPFLLEAFVQASTAAGQAAAQRDGDVLERLVRSLGSSSRGLLEVISLAGFPISKRLATEAAGVAPEDASSELKFLRAARWIRTGGPLVTDLVEPSHDRVRQTVLREVAVERRAALHRAIAAALDEARADPDKVAHHYLLGGERGKAAQNLRRAAERAVKALAFDHAASLLGRLIDLGGHDADDERGLLIAWADALASAGRGLEAAHAYEAAIPRCEGTLSLDLKRRVAEQYLSSGRFDDGMAACSAFLGAFGIALPATPRRALLQLVLLRMRVGLRGHGFKSRRPEQITPEELAHIDALWSMARGLANHDVLRAQVFQTQGLLRALAAGEPSRVSRALALEYVNVLAQNPQRERQAGQLLARARELATQHESAYGLGLAHFCRGMGAFAGQCRFAEALDAIEQGLQILRNECQNVAWEVSQSIQIAAVCRMYMGSWRALRDTTRDLQEAEARGDLLLGWSLRGHIMSFLSCVDDRAEVGLAEVEQAFGPFEQSASPFQRFLRELSRARVLLYAGRGEEALTAFTSQRASFLDSLLLRAPIARMQADEMVLCAALAAHLGRDDRLHLERAARLARRLERGGTPSAVPNGLLGSAAIAHLQRQPERALALLERAEAGFIAHQREGDAAAARRRRGQLLGGEEGRGLVAWAERWFTEQGVRNIPAMCRMLAPGFAGLDD
jgi:hypothetical protein